MANQSNLTETQIVEFNATDFGYRDPYRHSTGWNSQNQLNILLIDGFDGDKPQ